MNIVRLRSWMLVGFSLFFWTCAFLSDYGALPLASFATGVDIANITFPFVFVASLVRVAVLSHKKDEVFRNVWEEASSWALILIGEFLLILTIRFEPAAIKMFLPNHDPHFARWVISVGAAVVWVFGVSQMRDLDKELGSASANK